MKLTSIPATFKPERIALIGLPGTGKTTLAAALSESFNVIFIDTENDAAPLTKLPIAWQERINYIGIKDSAAVPIAAETLLKLFKNNRANICIKHSKVDCALCKRDGGESDLVDFNTLGPNDVVILNTATQLSSSILSFIMKDKPVDTKPERDDWGALRKYTEFFASQWQAVNFNFVAIFHAIEAELEDKKKKLVPAFGSAGMSAVIGGKFDHIIYTDIVNKSHRAFSSSIYSSSIMTKSRTDFEIEKLPKPSLIPIFSKILGAGVSNVENTVGNSSNDSGVASSVSNLSAGEVAVNNLTKQLGEMK